MAELMRRFREPITWLLLGVTVLYVVLDLAKLGWAVLHDHLGLVASARQITTSVGLVWILLDLAMVLCCVLIRPRIHRSVLVTRTAAIVVTVVVGYDLFLLVAGVAGAGSVFGGVLEVVGGLLEVLCKAVVAAVLWRIARILTTRHRAAVSGTSSKPVGTQPVWQPNDAAGVSWGRAADAAGMDPAAADHAGPSADNEQAAAPPEQNWTRGGSVQGLHPASGDVGPGTTGVAGHGPSPAHPGAPWLTAAEQAAGLEPPSLGDVGPDNRSAAAHATSEDGSPDIAPTAGELRSRWLPPSSEEH